MKQVTTTILLTILLSMVGTKALAYDIEVKNDDGVTIYYNYINDGKELEVTRGGYSGTVVIPEEVTYMNRTRKVTSIEYDAFYNCSSLTSVSIGNSVTSIGGAAFYGCSGLTSVTIPNSVTSIGNNAFLGCYNLKKVIASDIASWCGIKFENFDSNPLYVANHLYSDNNTEVTALVIPNSVTSIGDYAFYRCSGLTSVTIPNSVISIGNGAFYQCSGLTSVTIGNNVTSIGSNAFDGWDLPEVISKKKNPFKIYGKSSEYFRTFSLNTFNNATLYVPIGTIEKYKSTEGWKDFAFIEEGNGSGGTPTEPSKCEKPTISYQNGKLTFNCSTEGATYQYSITDTDIKAGNAKEIQLGVTYNISVYATKAGYDNSETATATLCWIDVDPKTEGITNSVANVRANPVLIQSKGNVLNISGAPEGAEISIFNLSGQKVGSARAISESTDVITSLQVGEVCIVKIGEKSVKIILK